MKQAVDRVVGAAALVVSACSRRVVRRCCAQRGRLRSVDRRLSGGAAAATAGAYIPIVSKGFQHQFWQAVKKGAEEEAAKENVKVNFEGPETESQVDKQIEMLAGRPRQAPGGRLLRGARQQGCRAAAAEVQGREYPGDRLRLRRR